MTQITTVGIGLAKSVFTVHGVGTAGKTVLRRRGYIDERTATTRRNRALLAELGGGAAAAC